MNTATLEGPWPQPAAEARFRALLEQYTPRSRHAAAYEPNRADREDLVQDVWLALWRALPNFRGECSERTFIYRIAHNRAIAHASRRRSAVADLEAAADLPHPSPTSEQVLDMVQQRARLLAAIRRLPILQREVVTPSLEDLSHAEIADVPGISENNVAVRLTRVREQGRRMSLALVGEYAVGLLFVCIAAWKLATDKGPDTFVWGFAVLWFTAMALQFSSENRRERTLRFTWILYGRQCVFLLAWLPAAWFLWPEQAWALIERLPLMIGLLALITAGLVAWTISARTAIRNERVAYERLRDELAASA